MYIKLTICYNSLNYLKISRKLELIIPKLLCEMRQNVVEWSQLIFELMTFNKRLIENVIYKTHVAKIKQAIVQSEKCYY